MHGSALYRRVLYVALATCHYSVTKLVGELSSTLGASSLKNFSTVSGCHSFSETMFLFSLSLLRLIGSFHDSTSFKIINVGSRKISFILAYSYESRVYYISKLPFCQEKNQIFFEILIYIFKIFGYLLTFLYSSAKIVVVKIGLSQINIGGAL